MVFAALTSGSPPLRAYPNELPAEGVVFPSVVWLLVAGSDDFNLRGRSQINQRHVQVDAWSMTQSGAASAMNDCVALMARSTDFSLTAINETGLKGRELDTKRYRESKEFTVWIQE